VLQKLLIKVQQESIQNQSTGLSTEAKLLLCLWTLANQETYRQVADRFGITRGYAHYLVKQTCGILSTLGEVHRIIEWPSMSNIESMARMNTFPGAFGAVDGCHIAIKTPLSDADSYINRKSYASVVLQAVCSSNLQFIDISTGYPGSMHDARIYRKSALSRVLNTSVDSSFHILGDSAYPLEKCLLVPYRDNGHLNQKQKQFNYHLSSSRCAIERAFALLKGKFRRLKYIDVNDIAAVPPMVTAACVLHNFILQNEKATGDLQTDSQDVTDGDTRVTCDCSAQVVLNTVAAKKRDDIASRL